MNTDTPPQDYLVISRGHWDKDKTREQIDTAITDFYDWLNGHIAAGRMRAGSRLGTDRASVSKAGVTTDGPFGEAKEVVGGYWFVSAGSLREAADLLSHSPTLPCGLHYEVRPLDATVCTASDITNETAPA
ncbi:YciI family protein [Prosthecobacter sp.]|uniref:YciI family protein n=1 Tax=Prosthecobacter sp. TaxID=1965333 RepID=UPI003782E526